MATIDVKPGDPIPDDEYIVRYCRKYSWERRLSGGYKVKTKAFRSGSDPDGGISVNWLGRFGKNEEISLKKVCETTTYGGINSDGVFLKFNTRDIRKISIESLPGSLGTIFCPDKPNESHAEIRPSGDAVFKALALHAESHGSLLEVPS